MGSTLLALVLFVLAACGMAAAANRVFRPVSWRMVALLAGIVCLYECVPLFTPSVDFPGTLAYHAYPWKATGHEGVRANTGIVFTQLAPWTRVARDLILAGEAPLWNRKVAAGTPLLANQQTAIFHPFTLLSFLLLPMGKAFTLSAALRLFFVLFFAFVLFRAWDVGDAAALFGAVAYTFCTFHIIWLLFPLGLATMMVPLALAAVQEHASAPRARTIAALTIALALSVLGGHPESAFWVWTTTAAYAVVLTRNLRTLASYAIAFALAVGLTAFVWMPTASLLPRQARYQLMHNRETNPPNHGLSIEWLVTLVSPNALGTPMAGNYTPPPHTEGMMISDYGEVTSGYAGIITLALALIAIATRGPHARQRWFFAALMLFAFLTIAEVPLWRELIRMIPLAGVTLHQRLRILWNLGACALAVLGVCDLASGRVTTRVRYGALGIVGFLLITVWFARAEYFPEAYAWTQALVPIAALALFAVASERRLFPAVVATVVTFAELALLTRGYNPVAAPQDIFPSTPAIETLARVTRNGPPARIASIGWSFLPDTPSYYGLEDIKTTDPIQDARYMELMRGFLHVPPGEYDQVFTDPSEPFFDLLNIRYLYVPPDQKLADPRFRLIYRGKDGSVLENPRSLPRYFVVQRFVVQAEIPDVIPRLKAIRDFRTDAVVHDIPPSIAEQAPQLAHEQRSAPRDVRLRSYGARETKLDISNAAAWSLVVSSDVDWPGWRAYWNGQRVPVVTVNGAFAGAFVPPGRGTLVFSYWPAAFVDGLRVSLFTLLLFVIALTLGRMWSLIPKSLTHAPSGASGSDSLQTLSP